MPARIVVVLNEPSFAEAIVSSLIADGLDALAVHDSMIALKLLEQARDVELLVTSSYFGEGKPTGAALALMTKTKRPNLKVIFAASHPEMVPLLNDIGHVLLVPASPATVSEAIRITITAK